MNSSACIGWRLSFACKRTLARSGLGRVSRVELLLENGALLSSHSLWLACVNEDGSTLMHSLFIETDLGASCAVC